jgi:hypothetical protein
MAPYSAVSRLPDLQLRACRWPVAGVKLHLAGISIREDFDVALYDLPLSAVAEDANFGFPTAALKGEVLTTVSAAEIRRRTAAVTEKFFGYRARARSAPCSESDPCALDRGEPVRVWVHGPSGLSSGFLSEIDVTRDGHAHTFFADKNVMTAPGWSGCLWWAAIEEKEREIVFPLAVHSGRTQRNYPYAMSLSFAMLEDVFHSVELQGTSACAQRTAAELPRRGVRHGRRHGPSEADSRRSLRREGCKYQ